MSFGWIERDPHVGAAALERSTACQPHGAQCRHVWRWDSGSLKFATQKPVIKSHVMGRNRYRPIKRLGHVSDDVRKTRRGEYIARGNAVQ